MRRERLLRWRHTKNETNWYEGCFFFTEELFFPFLPSRRRKNVKNSIEPKKNERKKQRRRKKKESTLKALRRRKGVWGSSQGNVEKFYSFRDESLKIIKFS